MKKSVIKNWNLLIDPAKTRQILENITSDAENCGCLFCKNFVAARDEAYPIWFLSVFDELGIDYKKDIHTCHTTELKEGLHLYQIDYCFSGKIVSGPGEKKIINMDSFAFNINDKLLYRRNEFPPPALVLECFPLVPWVINEE